MVEDPSRSGQESAVLCSGGLDSVVLVACEAQARVVQPVYIGVGFAWETIEREWLLGALGALPRRDRVRAAAVLTFDMRDVYPASHWAVRGTPPAYDTPDEDVYLVGRNVALLAKAAVFCASRRIARLAIGPLAGNPFPDATPAFFAAMAQALSLGLDWPIEIAAPFAGKKKSEVIGLGVSLGVPLECTLSCMNPQGILTAATKPSGCPSGVQRSRHCGACSKCRERQQAFREAGVEDRTVYATGPS